MTDVPRPPEDKHGRKPMTGVLAWAARNVVAANVLMVILIVGGLLMTRSIKQEVFPEFDLDMVVINVPYPGASPEEVEKGVTLALEEAVRGIDDVKLVDSTSAEGFAVVVVELMLNADADRALSDIESAIGRITSFPQNIEEPEVFLASTRQRVISLVVHGDFGEKTLRTVAEDVRERLLADERVTFVELSAVRPLEISIEVPRSKLRQYGLTLDQIAQKIRAASVELPAGGIKTTSGEVLLRTTERKDRGAEFEQIELLTLPDGARVRVGDIANVIDGFADVDKEASFDGERAVVVDVYRVGEQTPIEVSEAVHDFIAEHEDELPPGIHFSTWFDSSEFYEDRIDLLLRNAMLGLALVLITLGLFLEIKLAFWVTMGIPISFIGAMLFLPLTDVSINMISLFAFIVVLGMVVDDAIVVGEATYKRRAEGYGRLEAALAGVREVAVPVTFAIITTIIAFSPMLFVPGPAGKFFRVIPIVVIITLLLSLFESLFILPAHLAHSKAPPEHGVFGFIHHQQQRFSRGIEWLIERTYVPTLQAAVRNRHLSIAVAIGLMSATVGVIAGGRLQFTFMPKVESDVVTAAIELPFGAPFEDTQEVAARLEAAAQQIIADSGGEAQISRGVFTQVGGSSMGGMGNPNPGMPSGGSHIAEVSVYLVPMSERDITAGQFAETWRERVGDVVGVETLKFQYATGMGSGAPIDFELSHSNIDMLERAANDLAQRLRAYEGVIDVDNGFTEGKDQLDFKMKLEGKSRGLDATLLGQQVRSSFFGAEALRQQRGRDELKVYVRLPQSERETEYTIEDMLVRTPIGGEMSLGQAAEIVRNKSYTEIKRVNGRRVVNVNADVVPGLANANEVTANVIRDVMPEVERDYPGLTFDLGGEQRDQAESMSSLGEGLLLAMIVMIALLAIAFRSYTQWLIIMSVIPFGFVGAIWGHLIMGFDLSLMSFMGMVALAGVVVNDSLVLIVAINEYREQGMDTLEAVFAGGARRFRPILLTSLTTFFGLAPMILETSMQARFLIPMAISLGFGVLFATFLMLLLVPAVYMVVEDVKHALMDILGIKTSE